MGSTRGLWIALAVTLAGCGGMATDAQQADPFTGLIPPHVGASLTTPTDDASGEKADPGALTYHGGPLMTGGANLYLIWYGDWAGNSATSILPAWAEGIGTTRHVQTLSSYTGGPGERVLAAASYKSSTQDPYSQGSRLSDAQVIGVVTNAIGVGQVPLDSNGVYFVLTSPDVHETSGFCKRYCGWHNHGTVDGTDVKVAFVGSPEQCPSACEWQTDKSPNGNPAADAMASIMAHELDETVTDPDLNAWFDKGGAEGADKCAWTYGGTATTDDGAVYNASFGGFRWLIQRNWDAQAQACAGE